ncbi:MAG: hypothetical protein Q8L54_08110 [Devosia sp.]|nr:hypothetical protein [Devosia sp.]
MKRLLLGLGILLTGCSDDRSPTYTLYRNSPVDASMRVHVATYDANDRGSFNQGNCRHASDLLNKQGVVGVKWWCEEGRFRE